MENNQENMKRFKTQCSTAREMFGEFPDRFLSSSYLSKDTK